MWLDGVSWSFYRRARSCIHSSPNESPYVHTHALRKICNSEKWFSSVLRTFGFPHTRQLQWLTLSVSRCDWLAKCCCAIIPKKRVANWPPGTGIQFAASVLMWTSANLIGRRFWMSIEPCVLLFSQYKIWLYNVLYCWQCRICCIIMSSYITIINPFYSRTGNASNFWSLIKMLCYFMFELLYLSSDLSFIAIFSVSAFLHKSIKNVSLCSLMATLFHYFSTFSSHHVDLFVYIFIVSSFILLCRSGSPSLRSYIFHLFIRSFTRPFAYRLFPISTFIYLVSLYFQLFLYLYSCPFGH